ncbi:tail protein X [Bartonella sp. 220]|uniref:tail protein X n=1 Tax=Bartonella sp. 220B TaxID=2967260 RepID=UPI0022A95272|nr:tail protein X [Bartonella sp. 220B]MCZ2158997.1 tail protein X [Bartonella sp. 220B]
MKLLEKHVVVELEDMILDLIYYQHAMALLENRSQVWAFNGYLEATLIANPGIAQYGAVLPRGLEITLPEFVFVPPQSRVKRLWD